MPSAPPAVLGRASLGAIGAGDHRLAVQGERPRLQLGRGRSDGGIAVGPVIAAAGEQPHPLAVPANDQPVSVMLDLVHPVRARGRLGGAGWDAGVDEAIGADRRGNP
jgi:hypothetical protein